MDFLPDNLNPIWISFKIALPSALIAGFFGTLAGYFFSEKKEKKYRVLESILMIPIAFPPIVTGYILVILLGKKGLAGLGFPNFVFTQTAGIIAVTIICFPLMMKYARSSFEMVSKEYEENAWLFGKSKITTFFQIILPLSWPGIFSGWIICLARALGEFGASVMVMGSIAGKTDTLPIIIWDNFVAAEDEKAFSYVLILGIICIFLIILSEWINQKYIRTIKFND